MDMNDLKPADLLDIVSHELKTPMNVILGFAALLREGRPGSLSDEQQRNVKKIETNARHALEFIDNILGLSQWAEGKMPLCKESFPLRPLVTEVIENLGSLAEEKGLTLSGEVPGDLVVET